MSGCGSKKNSSTLDRTPKMRPSVLLNAWDSFLVTLPSICSETWFMYSSSVLGSDVFRDWPFLGYSSGVSLAAAASFFLFFNVAIFRRETAMQWSRLNRFFVVNQNESIAEKCNFSKKTPIANFKVNCNQSYFRNFKISTIVTPIYIFCSEGNKTVCKACQGTK